MDALMELREAISQTLRDVVPIALIIVFFQAVALRRPIPNWPQVLTGFVYVLLGIMLFLEGLEHALFPLGNMMAQQLADPAFVYGSAAQVERAIHWADYKWVYIFAAALGFATSIAEPSLIAVAMKAREVSGGLISVWGLRLAVALGVAIGLVVGTSRIVIGAPLPYFIMAAYAVIIVQTYHAPRAIVPLAYDLGGVTTSTVTVPLVAAMGLGLAGVIPGRSPMLDGFGLIAFACLFPIMTVMGYAQLSMRWARRGRRAEDELEH